MSKPLVEELSGCVICGNPGIKKCSSCKSASYCSRECQIKDWKKHKSVCKKLRSKNGKSSAKSSGNTPRTSGVRGKKKSTKRKKLTSSDIRAMLTKMRSDYQKSLQRGKRVTPQVIEKYDAISSNAEIVIRDARRSQDRQLAVAMFVSAELNAANGIMALGQHKNSLVRFERVLKFVEGMKGKYINEYPKEAYIVQGKRGIAKSLSYLNIKSRAKKMFVEVVELSRKLGTENGADYYELGRLYMDTGGAGSREEKETLQNMALDFFVKSVEFCQLRQNFEFVHNPLMELANLKLDMDAFGYTHKEVSGDVNKACRWAAKNRRMDRVMQLRWTYAEGLLAAASEVVDEVEQKKLQRVFVAEMTKAVKASIEVGHVSVRVNGNVKVATVLMNEFHEYDRAEVLLQDALEACKGNDSIGMNLLCMVQSTFGMLYGLKNEYIKAVKILRESIALYKPSDHLQRLNVMIYIVRYNCEVGEFQQALDCLSDVENRLAEAQVVKTRDRFSKRNLEGKEFEYFEMRGMALSGLRAKKLDLMPDGEENEELPELVQLKEQSREAFEAALKLAEDYKLDERHVLTVTRQMGDVEFNCLNYQSAVNYYNRVIQIAKTIDKAELSRSWISKAIRLIGLTIIARAEVAETPEEESKLIEEAHTYVESAMEENIPGFSISPETLQQEKDSRSATANILELHWFHYHIEVMRGRIDIALEHCKVMIENSNDPKYKSAMMLCCRKLNDFKSAEILKKQYEESLQLSIQRGNQITNLYDCYNCLCAGVDMMKKGELTRALELINRCVEMKVQEMEKACWWYKFLVEQELEMDTIDSLEQIVKLGVITPADANILDVAKEKYESNRRKLQLVNENVGDIEFLKDCTTHHSKLFTKGKCVEAKLKLKTKTKNPPHHFTAFLKSDGHTHKIKKNRNVACQALEITVSTKSSPVLNDVFGQVNDAVFSVLPFTVKCTLEEEIQNVTRPYTENEILMRLYCLLQGLVHLYENGFVHGDLQSSSIIVTDSGLPVISDFSRSVNCQENLFFLYYDPDLDTENEDKVHYKIPPELRRVRNADVVDYSKFDVYYLGLISYSLLAAGANKEGQTFPDSMLDFSNDIRALMGGMVEDFDTRLSCFDAYELARDMVESRRKEAVLRIGGGIMNEVERRLEHHWKSNSYL